MKPAKLTTLLVAGLFSCLSVTALYAVCVTPKQLTDGATATVAQAPFTDDFNFVNSVLNGKGPFKGLSTTAATSLGASGAPPAISLRLTANTQDWQTVPAVPYANAATPTAAEKMALQTTLVKVQKWASYGELVIAVDQNHIAILVPATTAADAGAATTPWGGLNAPHIAYGGTPAGANFPGVADAVMSGPFTDPSNVSFFRYKN